MKSGVPDKLCSCNEECLNIPTGGSLGGRLLLGHWVSCDDECCMLLLSDMIARESLDDDATASSQSSFCNPNADRYLLAFIQPQ